MHMHTPTRPGTHMHACTRKHTNTGQCVILIVFPQQQWFCDRATVLLYVYIACHFVTTSNDSITVYTSKILWCEYFVFLVITLGDVVWNVWFRTAYRSHIQNYFWAAWPLTMGPLGSPETSVSNDVTLHNISQDGRIEFNRGESLRYNILWFLHVWFSRKYWRLGCETFCFTLRKERRMKADDTQY
jgi:hypothetical protein